MGKNQPPDPTHGFIDLHIHTNYSDGTYTPQEVINLASKIGLKAISIADHDSISGLEEGIKSGQELSVEVIPGVELSADTENLEIHILGYFIDWQNSEFQKKLAYLARGRRERAEKMIQKMNSMGIKIDFEDVLKISGKGAIGRLHVAKALQNRGIVRDIQESFVKYIGKKSPAYVEKYRLTPKEAIECIKSVGGIAMVAHPGLMKRDEIIPKFKEYGLDGIEAYHTEHTPKMVKHYKEFAKKHDLLISGGSDCHGLGKGEVLMGKVLVPYSVLEDLKKYLQ